MGIKERVDKISDTSNLSIDTKVTTAKLEATGICNMDCIFCFNHVMKQNKQRQRFITDKDFSIMLDALDKLETIKEVGMFYMGESTIHPKLPYFYKVLKNHNYFTYLTCNNFNLNILSKAIPYIDSVKISFNTEYDDTQIKKIESLYNLLHSCNKTLSISSVIQPHENKDTYLRYNNTIPHDEWYYLPMQTQGGTIDIGVDGVVGEYDKQSSPIPCWSLFKGFYVDCELNVRTCCYGHHDTHILMNLEKEKFSKKEYYNRKRLYMKDHLEHRIPSICSSCIRKE